MSIVSLKFDDTAEVLASLAVECIWNWGKPVLTFVLLRVHKLTVSYRTYLGWTFQDVNSTSFVNS